MDDDDDGKWWKNDEEIEILKKKQQNLERFHQCNEFNDDDQWCIENQPFKRPINQPGNQPLPPWQLIIYFLEHLSGYPNAYYFFNLGP